MRIGFGYDVHAFSNDRKLILGGVDIPHTQGLLGHSDADVLVHAIMDALLGATALGDIGKHFPDTDPKFKDADSLVLLTAVGNILKENSFSISNIDSIVVAQAPKLAPFIVAMRQNIANALDLNINQVSVKATTTERLGFEGRKEGISSFATALIM